MKLVDKVAVITGGSKGIGKAIAKSFLIEGAKVIIGSRSSENVNNALKELYPVSKNIYGKAVDVSSFDQVKELTGYAHQMFQKIDILVNSAGIGIFSKVTESTDSQMNLMLNTNFKGVFYSCKAVLPYMYERNSGLIVNIISLAGKHGLANGSLYCASKFAVRGFSESLMLEVREHNIKVISLYPGSVDTEFYVDSNISPMNKDKLLKPEDIANVVTMAVMMDRRCMLNEIELRPTNPR
jgi:3-oxoacyl-[acyl-carrier protein] reductase